MVNNNMDPKIYINLSETNKVVFGVQIDGPYSGSIKATLVFPIEGGGNFSVDGVLTPNMEIEFFVPPLSNMIEPGPGEYKLTLVADDIYYEPFAGDVEFYLDDMDEDECPCEDEDECPCEEMEDECPCDEYDIPDIWEAIISEPSQDRQIELYKQHILGLDIPISREMVLEEIEGMKQKRLDASKSQTNTKPLVEG